jgi:hypothetical protein
MKKWSLTLSALSATVLLPGVAFAASNGEIEHFTQETLSTFIGFAAVAATLFLIRGAYLYIVSTGNPQTLDEAKKTIKNALLGLAIIIGAGLLVSLLGNALSQPSPGGLGTVLDLKPIQPVTQDSSLIKILLDAISGFLQNIVQSATKPVMDGIMNFLTSTPSLSTNSVVFNFWLVMVGITDSLFALVIALLGLQVMSAATFGFEELTLKEILPRIGLAFLAANTSIFLIDWIILLCQTLVHALLSATGGLEHAWLLNAFDPASLVSGSTLLITLIFMVVFLVMAIALLLFYITRLVLLALGAVLSPIICLVWLLPKMAEFAESAIKAYLITLFSVFLHVVIIQLASSFITIPGQVGANPFISLLVGIALLGILLKSASVTLQLTLASHSTGTLKKFGGQLLNILSPSVSRRVK